MLFICQISKPNLGENVRGGDEIFRVGATMIQFYCATILSRQMVETKRRKYFTFIHFIQYNHVCLSSNTKYQTINTNILLKQTIIRGGAKIIGGSAENFRKKSSLVKYTFIKVGCQQALI